MILCDTNIVIHYFNDHPQTVDAWNAIGKANILLPVITILQLYRGMNNKIELAQMRRKIRYYDIIHLNEAASRQATELLENFKLSHDLQIPDALIGATAITNDLPLFTYNVKDFSFMPGLTLYQPA